MIIALVTAAVARTLDEDLAPLAAALEARDARISIVDWDDASVDWSRFDAAVLRSTWDYADRMPEFLDWVTRVTAQTCLINPLEVLRWNTDKHYLAELGRAGVATVPSTFVEPGEDAAGALDAFLSSPAHGGTEATRECDFVVKPAVGAGSRDAQRHTRAGRAAALAHVARLIGARRSVLLQPYLDRVDAQGETALIHFGGEFSHAIRKGPLLRRDEGPTRGLFAEEDIAARTPSPEERAVADAALAALPFGGPLAYARIDLIRDAADAPVVLELELTEPSLFFAHSAGSAGRCAAAILARL
jgi:O-ureido-D-serine cyclo-ligase